MEIAETFKLNDEGYALLQKFILRRIEIDLEIEKDEFETLRNKQLEASKKSGFFNSIYKFHKDQSISKVEERIRKKTAWKEQWVTENKNLFSSNLESYSIQELIIRHTQTVIGRVQLFLILQEVVHTPIYVSENSKEKVGDEKHFEKTILEFSHLCNLNNCGQKIIDDTKSFFKDINKEGSNIFKWGLYGLVGVSAVAAILAVPVIAPAIGGVFGLSGAAATASGLAFLGGGSIAAGGLGMAGGMTVLVGGSGILGAVAGGAAGKLLSQLPQEAIALNIVKVVNLIKFLKSTDNRDRRETKEILVDAESLFLEFKYSSEKELIFNSKNKNRKESLKLADILTVGFKRII